MHMPFDWNLAFSALPILLGLALLTWLASLKNRDASLVDRVWSLFFLAALLTWFTPSPANGPRAFVALVLVGVWAVRLSGWLTWRNHGKPEDRRYQALRDRFQPHYELKSLVLVFALQATLAWLIALPILPVLKSGIPWNGLDNLACGIFLTGLLLETVADLQLARFKAQPGEAGAVLDSGLWRYSRHPNYFGECLLWWGFFLMAVAARAPVWLIVSPLILTVLLVAVSGVRLLESDIHLRRPAYRDYIRRTSAFFPWPPRESGK